MKMVVTFQKLHRSTKYLEIICYIKENLIPWKFQLIIGSPFCAFTRIENPTTLFVFSTNIYKFICKALVFKRFYSKIVRGTKLVNEIIVEFEDRKYQGFKSRWMSVELVFSITTIVFISFTTVFVGGILWLTTTFRIKIRWYFYSVKT